MKNPIAATRRRILLPLILAPAFPAFGQGYDASALVVAGKGNLPLILSAPHDGVEPVGTVAPRVRGVSVRDIGTGDLAQHVAALLEQRTGRRPYLVVAKFSRKYIDANRDEQEAVESPAALPAYRAYHDQLAAHVAEVRSRFPAGALLLDLHGQSQVPDTTFRGTRAGLTARSLLQRAGKEALQGDKSILGQLASRGHKVHPAIGAGSLSEDRRFDGGYTVFRYGSQNTDGIDAIQLEFGRDQRANARLPEDLAEALIVFMQAHGLMRQ